jgi:hypothetical protein
MKPGIENPVKIISDNRIDMLEVIDLILGDFSDLLLLFQ